MSVKLTTLLAASLMVTLLTACSGRQPQSYESNQNSRFIGRRSFELATPDKGQADALCMRLCEETCGGTCYGIMEVYTRCHQENPSLEYPSGLTAGERLDLCLSRSPGFVKKYPYWYNTEFQSVVGAPVSEKWPCEVSCH